MSETKEQIKPPTFEELKRFEFIKVLNTCTKKINLLGYLSTLLSTSSDDPTLQKHHVIFINKNDIYHWYDGLLNKDEKLPDINMTLICPATETKKILEFVPKKFMGVGADELRLFVHYLPSYYHFHIHITHLSSDTIPDGIAISKAYLLDDIITNLELFSGEYYQKTILTYIIGENDLLFSNLNDVGASRDGAVQP
ncbi:22037_t:CDS:2, partial [Entrophospora sp. SA101]